MEFSGRIELHYHTGGHGGPYFTDYDAIEAAVRLLKGSRTETTIDLRNGVGGKLIASVSKTKDPHRLLVTYPTGYDYSICGHCGYRGPEDDFIDTIGPMSCPDCQKTV